MFSKSRQDMNWSLRMVFLDLQKKNRTMWLQKLVAESIFFPITFMSFQFRNWSLGFRTEACSPTRRQATAGSCASRLSADSLLMACRYSRDSRGSWCQGQFHGADVSAKCCRVQNAGIWAIGNWQEKGYKKSATVVNIRLAGKWMFFPPSQLIQLSLYI